MHLSFLAVLLSVFMFSSCKNATPGKPVLLKFNLKKGDTYLYTMNAAVENETGENKQTTNMLFEYSVEVLDDSAGFKILKSTYNRIAMDMKGGDQNIDIDTKKTSADSVINPNSGPKEMISPMFHAIVGKSFVMKVDAEGQVIEVSGLNEMGEAVLNSLKLPEQLKPNVSRLFSAQFSAESLKQSFSQSFNIFPNKTVKEGDSWDKSVNLPGMVAGSIKTNYKVKSIAEDKVTLDVVSSIEIGKNKGTQTGIMVVDPKEGLVTRGNLTQDFEGKMKNKITITGKRQ